MKRVWLAVVIMAIVIVAVLGFERGRRRNSIVILPPSARIKAGLGLRRFVSARWTWFWRLESRLAPKRRMILLTCTFFELKEDPADWARKFKLGSPTQEGNGSRIWILPPEKLLALTQSTNFPVISAPRMQTLDRLPSHLAVGRTNGVLSVDLSPRMRTDEVDLTAIIRTTHLASNHGEDFTTAFEAQLPYGSVVLVVDARPRGAMTERLGELLTAEEIDRTGRSVKHSKSNSQ